MLRTTSDRGRRSVCTLVLAFLALSLTASTVTAQQARTITFDEALQLALNQNIDLQKSERSLELEGAQVSSARADFLPNLNFSIGPSQSYGLIFDQTVGDLVSTTSERLSLNASASVNLFSGFGNVANLQQSRSLFDVADYTLDRTRQDVLSSVALNFLQVLLDREQIEIQEENLAAQEQLLARVQEFTRVGTRPISELYQQEAQVAQAELELLNAERSYQLSQVALIQELQLDPLQNYEFVAPPVEDIEPVPQEYDLGNLFQQAFENRADLKAQRSLIDAAEQGVRVARSGMYPSISLAAGGGSAYSSLNTAFDFEDQLFRNNRSGSIRLNVQIPVFNRLNTRTQIEQAQIQYANSRLDLEGAQQRVALEVRQAYLDYLTDIKQLDVTEKQRLSAERALEAEQERYNVGASTLVELTQIRAQYVQAANNRATAVYRFLTRSKLLAYYTGTIDPTQSIFE